MFWIIGASFFLGAANRSDDGSFAHYLRKTEGYLLRSELPHSQAIIISLSELKGFLSACRDMRLRKREEVAGGQELPETVRASSPSVSVGITHEEECSSDSDEKDLESFERTPPQKPRENPVDPGSKNVSLALTTDPTPLPMVQQVLLSPANLFEKPLRLERGFLSHLSGKLDYLHACGLTVDVVLRYFDRNWERIKEDPVLLDVGCDVGLCHLQAVVNQMLLSTYCADQIPIPTYVKAYFAFCLLLSDHSEIRNGERSVSFLHHPEHATTLKNPEKFPLSGFVRANKKKNQEVQIREKKMTIVGFFVRLRMLVAAQALLFASSERNALPILEFNNLGGILIPKIAYHESFRIVFELMQKNTLPFQVEVVHISSPTMQVDKLLLESEVAPGFYDDKVVVNGSVSNQNRYGLILQMFTLGLSVSEREGMLAQLCNFDVMERVTMEIIQQTKGLGRSPKGTAVCGWLSSVFKADQEKNSIYLFDDKFDLYYINRLVRSSRSGLAPRHVYCSTPAAFEAELKARSKVNDAD